MRKERKNHTAEEKVAILRQHLLDGVPVSDLCEKHRLQPTVFYQWQKRLFEKGAAAFERDQAPGKNDAARRKLAALEEKVRKKDEVLVELMTEHVALRKGLEEN